MLHCTVVGGDDPQENAVDDSGSAVNTGSSVISATGNSRNSGRGAMATNNWPFYVVLKAAQASASSGGARSALVW